MTAVALVTAAAARDLDEDLPPLEAALRAAPASHRRSSNWDDAGVDWSRVRSRAAALDLGLLAAPARVPAWAERVSAATTLAQSAAGRALEHRQALPARSGEAPASPIVPSTFVEPGEDAAARSTQFLDAHAAAEFVVKPSDRRRLARRAALRRRRARRGAGARAAPARREPQRAAAAVSRPRRRARRDRADVLRR